MFYIYIYSNGDKETMETCIFPCLRKLERAALSVLNAVSHHRVYVYRYFLLSPLSPCLRVEMPEI